MYKIKSWLNKNLNTCFRLDIYPEFFGGNKRKAYLIRTGQYKQAMIEDAEFLRGTNIKAVVDGVEYPK